jgi:gluconate:H+ symporter, GntP family
MSTAAMLALVTTSIVLIVLLTSKLKLNAFFSLILVALALALATLPADNVIGTIKTGFGNTLAVIGLIIIFGTTIGVLLDRTGATYSMAWFILRFTGREKVPRAMAITGFAAGLPIFCDSGFIVLSGLNKSLARAAGIPMPRMAATLAVALYVLHCLIPPHPGITAATGIISGSMGNLILAGIGIAVPSTVLGYVWVKVMSRKYPVEALGTAAAREAATGSLPNPLFSFLPVLAPLLLIMANSSAGLVEDRLPGVLVGGLKFTGDPVVALLIGVLLCLPLLKGSDFGRLNGMFAEAIEKAGPILAITAAGGAFGSVIKATGLGDQVSAMLTASNLGLLVSFLLAAILKTAQGSSTVAAITSASIVAPMLPGLGLDGEWGRTCALLAIGSGSMMISHANDSYYWVITRFSEIQPQATLRVYSSDPL